MPDSRTLMNMMKSPPIKIFFNSRFSKAIAAFQNVSTYSCTMNGYTLQSKRQHFVCKCL